MPASTSGSQSPLVVVAASLDGGGAERQLVEMANYWSARGRRVTLVSWNGSSGDGSYGLAPGVHRAHFDVGATGGLRRAWRVVAGLRALFAAQRPETVLSFIVENNVLTLAASLGLPLRVAVSERAHPGVDTSVSRSWRLLRALLYRRATRVIAQTRATATWLERHCHVQATVIPNALRRLDEPSGERENLVVAIGRLTRQKGFDLLLHAFAGTRAFHPDWRLIILGEGPERAALRKLCVDLGVDSSVSMPGVEVRVEQWLMRAGLVVQPSRFEGFPNAVLEAMGMGAAVISADCLAGPSDMIEDGINGRLVPVEDVAALSQAMHQLMSQPQERARLGERAREVRQRFNQEKIMCMWDAALAPSEAVR
jgi:glycosyltransferase involved in cell wall biosynthesis